ncbi:hypothetical protein MGAST_02895 [Mycobacterium gastri 'Wayne']|nr:hypothetical protein MGAST_02895 [Mycobacterium gastri 'Wayne']
MCRRHVDPESGADGRGRVIALVLQLFLQVTLLVGRLPGVVGVGRRVHVLIHEKSSGV